MIYLWTGSTIIARRSGFCSLRLPPAGMNLIVDARPAPFKNLDRGSDHDRFGSNIDF